MRLARKKEAPEEVERKQQRIKATEVTEKKWTHQPNYQDGLKEGYAKRNRQQSRGATPHL